MKAKNNENKPETGNSENTIENIKQKSFENNTDLLLALYVLIKNNKKWWLLPLLIILAFLSLFVSLTGNQSILPAIYALF